MNITMKLFFASILVLAAIGMSTAAQAAEPENRDILASVDEPDGSTNLTDDLHVDEECSSATVSGVSIAPTDGGATVGLTGHF